MKKNAKFEIERAKKTEDLGVERLVAVLRPGCEIPGKQIRLVSLSGMSAAVDSFGHPGEIAQNRRDEHCDLN